MTDRELLELAAKAAGYELTKYIRENSDGFVEIERYACWDKSIMRTDWNPLKNSGDALRLAVDLRIHIEWAFVAIGRPEQINASPKGLGHCSDMQPLGDDPYAATRRAIVRAAAEIGRSMS